MKKVNDRRVKFEYQIDPQYLFAYGPIIPVTATLPEHTILKRSKIDGIKTDPILAKMVIDTGSNISYLDPEIIDQLGLPLFDEEPRLVSVLSERPEEVFQYLGALEINFTKNGFDCQFIWSGFIHSLPPNCSTIHYQGLLGRDFLRVFETSFNFRDGIIGMRYAGRRE